MPRLPIILLIFVALLACVPSGAQANALGGPKTFHGATCTKDCSGHKAGYKWAQKKNIQTEAGCRAKAKSFNEGCKIWVREQTQSPPTPAPEK